MKPDRLLLLLLIPPVALVSTATSQPAVTDPLLHDQVETKIAEAALPGGGAIVVDVKDGVVTLTGNLPTQKEKTQAAKIAKKVHGVKSVVNNITVVKP